MLFWTAALSELCFLCVCCKNRNCISPFAEDEIDWEVENKRGGGGGKSKVMEYKVAVPRLLSEGGLFVMKVST